MGVGGGWLEELTGMVNCLLSPLLGKTLCQIPWVTTGDGGWCSSTCVLEIIHSTFHFLI